MNINVLTYRILQGRTKYIIVKGDDQINSYLEILSVFVYPKYERKGFASYMIKQLSKIAQKENIGYICTRANPLNEAYNTFLVNNDFYEQNQKILYYKNLPVIYKIKQKIRRKISI